MYFIRFIFLSVFHQFRNSPTGKQYIDNAKYKLIMKILLENVDLAAGNVILKNIFFI